MEEYKPADLSKSAASLQLEAALMDEDADAKTNFDPQVEDLDSQFSPRTLVAGGDRQRKVSHLRLGGLGIDTRTQDDEFFEDSALHNLRSPGDMQPKIVIASEIDLPDRNSQNLEAQNPTIFSKSLTDAEKNIASQTMNLEATHYPKQTTQEELGEDATVVSLELKPSEEVWTVQIERPADESPRFAGSLSPPSPVSPESSGSSPSRLTPLFQVPRPVDSGSQKSSKEGDGRSASGAISMPMLPGISSRAANVMKEERRTQREKGIGAQSAALPTLPGIFSRGTNMNRRTGGNSPGGLSLLIDDDSPASAYSMESEQVEYVTDTITTPKYFSLRSLTPNPLSFSSDISSPGPSSFRMGMERPRMFKRDSPGENTSRKFSYSEDMRPTKSFSTNNTNKEAAANGLQPLEINRRQVNPERHNSVDQLSKAYNSMNYSPHGTDVSDNTPSFCWTPSAFVHSHHKAFEQRSGGKFTTIETLGNGTAGTVLRVEQNHTGKQYACKVIPKFDHDGETLRKEIEILRAFDHPNIIRLYETFEDQEHIYLLMELSSGGDLMDVILSRGKIDVQTARRYSRQIFSALAYCHAYGIAHMDIKPENLVLCGNDLKLVDFGIARSSRSPTNGDNSGTIGGMDTGRQMEPMGSSSYMAPELFEEIIERSPRNEDGRFNAVYENHPSFRCDCWSAGCVIYTMLTGSLPFGDGYTRSKTLDFGPEWDSMPDAKTLVANLLNVSSYERWTARTALECAWLCGVVQPPSPRDHIASSPVAPYSPNRRLLRGDRKEHALKNLNLISASGGGGESSTASPAAGDSPISTPPTTARDSATPATSRYSTTPAAASADSTRNREGEGEDGNMDEEELTVLVAAQEMASWVIDCLRRWSRNPQLKKIVKAAIAIRLENEDVVRASDCFAFLAESNSSSGVIPKDKFEQSLQKHLRGCSNPSQWWCTSDRKPAYRAQRLLSFGRCFVQPRRNSLPTWIYKEGDSSSCSTTASDIDGEESPPTAKGGCQSTFVPIHISDEEMSALVSTLDGSRNGYIDYTLFIAALVDESRYHDEASIREAFEIFDFKNTGNVDVSDFRSLIERGSPVIKRQGNSRYEQVMAPFDLDNDHSLSFEEFVIMMREPISKNIHTEVKDPSADVGIRKSVSPRHSSPTAMVFKNLLQKIRSKDDEQHKIYPLLARFQEVAYTASKNTHESKNTNKSSQGREGKDTLKPCVTSKDGASLNTSPIKIEEEKENAQPASAVSAMKIPGKENKHDHDKIPGAEKKEMKEDEVDLRQNQGSPITIPAPQGEARSQETIVDSPEGESVATLTTPRILAWKHGSSKKFDHNITGSTVSGPPSSMHSSVPLRCGRSASAGSLSNIRAQRRLSLGSSARMRQGQGGGVTGSFDRTSSQPRRSALFMLNETTEVSLQKDEVSLLGAGKNNQNKRVSGLGIRGRDERRALFAEAHISSAKTSASFDLEKKPMILKERRMSERLRLVEWSDSSPERGESRGALSGALGRKTLPSALGKVDEGKEEKKGKEKKNRWSFFSRKK